jgi:hypothetical protein
MEPFVMQKLLAIIPAVLIGAAPLAANADEGLAVGGAVGGAATGAVVGGPVGAVIGGVLGAVIGGAIEPPPPEVVTYVQGQTLEPVYLDGQLVVGATVPSTIYIEPVPQNVYVAPDGRLYGYAVVNGQQVVIDMQTRAIVAIVG